MSSEFYKQSLALHQRQSRLEKVRAVCQGLEQDSQGVLHWKVPKPSQTRSQELSELIQTHMLLEDPALCNGVVVAAGEDLEKVLDELILNRDELGYQDLIVSFLEDFPKYTHLLIEE